MLTLAVVVLLCLTYNASGFVPTVSKALQKVSKGQYSMDYIPDGLTKAQWEKIKQKEAEEVKRKGNLGALGTTRFRSRSFEAWQKSGAKHLFPVDPNAVSYEERPYMQRRGGDWEGKDLKKMGLEGRGQGTGSRKLEVDGYYEEEKKAGRLESMSIFGGLPLPWTNEQAQKVSNQGPAKPLPKSENAKAGKQLSQEEMNRLKSTLFKPIKKTAAEDAADKKKAEAEAGAKKGGFFKFF